MNILTKTEFIKKVQNLTGSGIHEAKLVAERFNYSDVYYVAGRCEARGLLINTTNREKWEDAYAKDMVRSWKADKT